MQLANHHAHTHFSDGKGSPEHYIKEAIAQKLEIYGFSDHAPIQSQYVGCMSMENLIPYFQEIDRLKEAYDGKIEIYKGLEVDYMPDIIDSSIDYIQAANLDYKIGAIHYVDCLPDGRPWGFQSSHEEFQEGIDKIYEGDIKACVHRYYELCREMVIHDCPDIVAHLDRIKKLNRDNRYFDESETWYRNEVIKTLELIAKYPTILEINTKGYYNQETEDVYPGKWALEIVYELGIPVHLASDAHRPENITKGFDYAEKLVSNIGFKNYRLLSQGEWQDFPIKKASVFSV